MNVNGRLEELLVLLNNSEKPLSGGYLSAKLNVSRQIIVKDIDRLRERGYTIFATTKGYILDKSWERQRIFKVYHKVEDTSEELNLIVDLGAEVRDVFIFHKVYGEIHAPLNIKSRKNATDFLNRILEGVSTPLMSVTSGYHYHTVTAKDEETLNLVEENLRKNGFLAELTEFEPSSVIGK